VEASETIRKRLQAIRERQLERFEGTKLTCNAEMGPQRSARLLQDRCCWRGVVEGGDAAVASVGAGVSPGVEAGEDDHDFFVPQPAILYC